MKTNKINCKKNKKIKNKKIISWKKINKWIIKFYSKNK